MALQSGPPVDVFLATLDQQSPVTSMPLGRLSRLVNAVVKKFMNPRAEEGTSTRVRVEKRDAFLQLSTTTRTLDGATSTFTGTPQVLYDGGDALREIAGNRLFTRAKDWVKASSSTDGDTVVFPQTLRSSEIYTADSQAEAPDIAIVGEVACIVWREVALGSSTNAGSPSTTPVTGDGARCTFIDGTTRRIIRPAFSLNPAPSSAYLKVRVVAYGNQFWVLWDQQTAAATVAINVSLFNGNGVFVASTVIAAATNNVDWDVTAVPGQGVVVAMPNNAGGIAFTTLDYTFPFITMASATDLTIKHTVGQPVAWLTDLTGDSNVAYLVTGFTSGTTSLYANKIVSMASTHEYPAVATGINTASTYWISGIAGYAVPFATGLVVAYSLMEITGEPEATRYGVGQPNGNNTQASDSYPNQLDNLVVSKAVPFTGASTTIKSRFSMSLASRAFNIDGDYVALAYYPGAKVPSLSTVTAAAPHQPQRPANPSNFQPTWYVIPLASKQAFAGRFEYGLATADWQVLAWDGSSIAPGVRNRCLSSVVPTSLGALAVPLGYRAEQNIPSAKLFTQETGTAASSLFGGSGAAVVAGASAHQDTVTKPLVYQTDNTVGVKLFTIGPDCGQPFAVNTTTFVPGLMAGVIEQGDATMAEHGLAAVEVPYVVKSATASTVSADGLFFWRVVPECSTQAGKTYRGIPSAAFGYRAVVADAVALDVGVHQVAPTLRKNVRLSVYRTAYTKVAIAGAAQVTDPPTYDPATTLGFTSVFYKTTNDLRPFYNDPAAASAVFTDLCNDANQAVGEVLYTDQGQLPRYPAPAFRGGCVWQNRAWLIGYDNALWFSGEIAEGEGEWFNPGFRVVVPTTEEITAIAPMENFLLIYCASSVWYLPLGAALPDATGTGTVPVPVCLPFEMGGTGFTAVVRQGCMYSSSTGGIWMITRALDNVWVGESVQDTLSNEITGMSIVGTNVIVATRTGGPMSIVVFDTVLGAWLIWHINADNALSTTLVAASGGRMVWGDAARVFAQTPGSYLDDGDTFVPMSGVISPVHIGGVRNWKRTWAIELQGDVYDPCALEIGLSYSDSGIVDATYAPKSLTTGVLEEEVRPTKQLAASVGITFTESETDATVSGQGIALEVVSFYIGLEKGFKKGVPRIRKTA